MVEWKFLSKLKSEDTKTSQCDPKEVLVLYSVASDFEKNKAEWEFVQSNGGLVFPRWRKKGFEIYFNGSYRLSGYSFDEDFDKRISARIEKSINEARQRKLTEDLINARNL